MANDCKYNRIETVVSYDGGVSWESQTPPVYHRGTLIEPHSQDCETGSTLERWIVIEGDYLCDDNNRKYKKEMLENSYDGGVTWYPSNPTTFRLGQFVSVDVDFCSYSSESHYIIPDKSEGESCAEELSCRTMYMPAVVNGICTCVYVDPIKVIKCSTDTLTENNLSNGNYGLQTLKVGECTRVIDINENSSFANIFMRPYLTTIDTSKAVNLQIIDDDSFSFCDGIYRVAGQSFRKGDGLQSIVIPSGVTSIGDFAFVGCSAMTSVTIDDAPVTIGYGAFQGCSSLNTLDLGNNTISIGEDAFQDCSSLAINLTIPSSVSSIGDNAFYGCPLVSVTCLATTPPTIGEYSEPFDGNYSIYVPCESLYTYLSSTGWSGYSNRIRPIPPCEVTPKYVFTLTGGTVASAYCDSTSAITSDDTYGIRSKITSISIGECVTSISASVFHNCTGLTSVEIPSGITSIGSEAFRGCENLSTITVYATTPPTLGNLAFDTSNLGTIYVPCESLSAYRTSWSTYYSYIHGIPPCAEPYKFIATYSDSHTESGQCTSAAGSLGREFSVTNLTALEIGECVSGVSSGAVSGVTSISSVTMSDNVTSIGDGSFNGCTNLSSLAMSSGITTIGNSAFTKCTSLTSVAIPSTTTSIGNYAFYQCSGLTSCSIESGSIGYSAFKTCQGLTSCTLGSGVTSIGQGAFQGCTGLTSINIPSGVTSIGTSTFYECKSLRSIDIPNSVTTIGTYAFLDCYSLTSVTIASSVTSIGDSAFSTCSGLTTVTVPDSVTSLGSFAFNNCSNLTSVTLPSGITSISTALFQGCSHLASIDIPSGVTSIGVQAFSGCTRLSSVTMPNNLATIGNKAFYNCNSFRDITLPSTVTSIGDNAFYINYSHSSVKITILATTPPTLGSMVFDSNGTLKIYVPDASVSAYQTAWTDYASKIHPLSEKP